MPSVSLVCGWSEGPWQSRKFRHALRHAGFSITNDTSRADIIVAHSMGCYAIPKNISATLILLIGLPYWPKKPVFVSIMQNISHNFQAARQEGSAWWLNKLLHNTWYIFTRPQDNYRALVGRQLDNLPHATSGRQVVISRNRDDTFCRPDVQTMLPETFRYISMGTPYHEDCWFEPETYVELLKSLKNYG